MKAIVSVIVPIYNSAKYLNRCIDSLLKQEYEAYEIILVDNGSTDNSYEICKSFSELNKNITLFRCEERGANAARKCGFKLSQGEYICFIDSDDYVEKNYLKDMIDSAIKEKSDLVICGYYTDYMQFTTVTLPPYYSDTIATDEYISTLFGEIKNGPNLRGFFWNRLYKKELICEEYFDSGTNYLEDHIFNIRYAERVDTISVIKEPLYHYCVNISSITQQYYAERLREIEYVDMFFSNYLSQNKNISANERFCRFRVVWYFAVIENACKSGSYNEYKKEINSLANGKFGKENRRLLWQYSFCLTEKVSALLIKLNMWRLLFIYRKYRINRSRKE